MRQRISNHKRNSKSLLSITIEQIKKDLNEEYNETPVRSIKKKQKQKKVNKKNFTYLKPENEKTNNENNENINYNNINYLKIKNKKSINMEINNSNYNQKNTRDKNKYNNYYQSSSDQNNNYLKYHNESILQNQIKDLKIKSQNMKDKLIIFLKLMKKYSSKLTTLAKSNSRNNNTKEKKSVIDNEIKSTLSQLNKMLNNPKLNEDIFEIQDISNNNISLNNDEILNLTIPQNTNYNIITTNPTLSNNNKNDEDINTNLINSNIIATEVNSGENENIKKQYAKDIEGLIEKYEEKINLLNSENDSLKRNNIEQNNYVNSLIFEVNELKNKLKQEKQNYENNLIKLNNDSINLQKKVDTLQDENNILKKNCVELSQNFTKLNNFEKNDININNSINIEKELEHKNNVIKYLEGLLRTSGINTSNYNYMINTNRSKNFENRNENNIKFSKTKNELEYNINEKNDEYNKQYFTFYNMNPKSINSFSEIKNSRENSGLYSPKIIQQEIDDIDKEIVDLQKQLKKLLNE